LFDVRAQPNYPVAIEVLAGTTLTVKFVYDPACFTGSAVAPVLAYLRLVFEALAADAVDRIGLLPLLTPHERELIARWNCTAADFPRDRCVHSFVEAHARGMPGSIAVSDASTALTYEELNYRANRLARRLQKLGVTRGSLVAVCMNRRWR
jgi:non-ribosomal peptide synthetase component F